MTIPHKNAALDIYYEAGVYLAAALQLEPDTAVLATTMLQMEQENLAVQDGMRAARTEQIRAYVRVIWADRKMDDCIRDLSETAKSSDRRQPALRAHARLFPSGGFSGLIKPSGRMVGEEIKEIRKLFPLLQELGAKEPAFLSFPARLETLCSDAEAHLRTLVAADLKLEQQYVQSGLFRERWREQAYLVEAELLKLFPGQKDRVRAYFDTPASARSAGKKEEDPTKKDENPTSAPVTDPPKP